MSDADRGETRGDVGAPRCANATDPEQQLLALCLLHRGSAGQKTVGTAATYAETYLPSVRALCTEYDYRRLRSPPPP